jgi:hypothetical protein
MADHISTANLGNAGITNAGARLGFKFQQARAAGELPPNSRGCPVFGHYHR